MTIIYNLKLILLIIPFVALSQSNRDYDIHILLKDKIEFDDKERNQKQDTVVSIYYLEKQHNLDFKFKINQYGELLKEYIIKGATSHNLRSSKIGLYYVNLNYNNQPDLINRYSSVKDILKLPIDYRPINILRYPLDFNESNFEKVYDIIERAKNIYIMYNCDDDNYCMRKKVMLELKFPE